MNERAREAPVAAQALGARFAAAGGAAVALLALLRHAPVWLACLAGGATLAALSFTARLGVQALRTTIALDQRAAAPRKEEQA